jgi:hypothetical protein
MEWIVGVLTGILALVSPVGVVSDRLVENSLRDRLEAAESLEVRIDTVPTHQLLQGRVDRVRIAGRGLYPFPDTRIALLDLETDAIDLRTGPLRRGRVALQEPLQAVVHVVLLEADVQRALQSEVVVQQLQDWARTLVGNGLEAYDLVNPQVQFLGDRRLRLAVDLQDRAAVEEAIALEMELGLEAEGSRVQIQDPLLLLDGEPLPPELVNPLVQGLNQSLNWRALDDQGIAIRILHWQLDEEALAMVTFVRVDPGAL